MKDKLHQEKIPNQGKEKILIFLLNVRIHYLGIRIMNFLFQSHKSRDFRPSIWRQGFLVPKIDIRISVSYLFIGTLL